MPSDCRGLIKIQEIRTADRCGVVLGQPHTPTSSSPPPSQSASFFLCVCASPLPWFPRLLTPLFPPTLPPLRYHAKETLAPIHRRERMREREGETICEMSVPPPPPPPLPPLPLLTPPAAHDTPPPLHTYQHT